MAGNEQELSGDRPVNTVRQGEPTYADDAGDEAARRSKLRQTQHQADTGFTVKPGEAEPELGDSGQGQYGPGAYPGGGSGQSGYGGDFGQRQNGQDSFGGEEVARSGPKAAPR